MNAVQGALALDAEAPTLALRPYQEEAIAAILAGRDRGLQRLLIVMATGAGKTVVFSHLAHRLGCRTLVLAHREELIDQAAGKLRTVLGPGVAVGIVKAGRNEVHAHVLVGSIQTVTNSKRLRQLPRDIGLVIVDECHHSTAATYRRILEGLGCFRASGPLLLGVTATPDRADGSTIGDTIFQEQVYERSMIDLIEAGYLCDVRAKRVELAADIAGVRVSGGDFKAGELATALLSAGAVQHVVTAYKEYGEGRKTLVFTPTVAMAHDIADLFRQEGVPAEAIDGTTHPELRRATLRRLASGETRVVCNCAVLTEGFDEPSLGCLIIARPTKSRPLFVQMLGRGMRIHPGKVDCLVLDLVGNAGKHDVASVPNVFGLGQQLLELGSVKEAVQQARARAAAAERTRKQRGAAAALVSQEVSLLRRDSRMHWVAVETATGRYMALNLGNGLLKLGRDPRRGGWSVVLNAPAGRPRILASGVDQRKATSVAEHYARANGAIWAIRPGMTWRAEPVSQRTRVFARAIGCTLPPGCTAGEASDRILIHHAINGF